MTITELLRDLEELGACGEAMDFLRGYPEDAELEQIWKRVVNPGWITYVFDEMTPAWYEIFIETIRIIVPPLRGTLPDGLETGVESLADALVDMLSRVEPLGADQRRTLVETAQELCNATSPQRNGDDLNNAYYALCVLRDIAYGSRPNWVFDWLDDLPVGVKVVEMIQKTITVDDFIAAVPVRLANYRGRD